VTQISLSQPLDVHCRLEAPAGRRRTSQQAFYAPSQQGLLVKREACAAECS